jgi:hypothetical protein
VTVQGNNGNASTEAGENTGGGLEATVWYMWTAPTNGVVYFSGETTIPNFILSIGTYRGTAINALVPAGSTPDGGIPVAPGDEILLQVGTIYYGGGLGGGRGPFTLHVRLEVPGATAPNDAFTNRLEIATPAYHFEGNIYGATNEPSEPLPTANARQTLWWTITPPEEGLFTLWPSAGQFTAQLALYEGNQLDTLNPIPALTGRTFRLLAEHTYSIQLATEAANSGNFVFDTRFYSLSNDLFSGSVRFEGTNVTVHGERLVATFEAGEPNPGGTNTIGSPAAPATGRVWFSLTGLVGTDGSYTGPTMERLLPVRLVPADNNVSCFLAEEERFTTSILWRSG